MESMCFSRRQIVCFALSSALILSSGLWAQAASAGEDPFILQCHAPTPALAGVDYPGANKIILSNNLARPAGKSDNAPGQLLFISGRVTDENCVPVANAIVDIWQANPFGQYRWAARDELLNPEPVFAGNGRAVTDNMGRYQFTTLFPGAYGKQAPHVNLRITHPDFKELATVMYFRGDRRNSSDPRFKAQKPIAQALLLGDVMLRDPNNASTGIETTFNITLKGSSTFRSY